MVILTQDTPGWGKTKRKQEGRRQSEPKRQNVLLAKTWRVWNSVLVYVGFWCQDNIQKWMGLKGFPSSLLLVVAFGCSVIYMYLEGRFWLEFSYFIGVGREVSETRGRTGNTSTDDPVFPLLWQECREPSCACLGKSLLLTHARRRARWYFCFPLLSASVRGFHIAAYSVCCYGGRTAGRFPCQKTLNFWELYFSSGTSVRAQILSLCCACVLLWGRCSTAEMQGYSVDFIFFSP